MNVKRELLKLILIAERTLSKGSEKRAWVIAAAVKLPIFPWWVPVVVRAWIIGIAIDLLIYGLNLISGKRWIDLSKKAETEVGIK